MYTSPKAYLSIYLSIYLYIYIIVCGCWWFQFSKILQCPKLGSSTCFNFKPETGMIRNRQSFIVSERVLSSAAQERCICHGHFSFSDEDEPTLAGLQPEDATEGDRDLHKTLTKSTGKSLFWMGKYGKDLGNIYHEMSGNG